MLNNVTGFILIMISFYLIYAVYDSKINKKKEIVIRDINYIGAALLILIMAYGFFSSNREFCEIVPEIWFCK